MPAPLTPEQREAVLAAARSGASRNEVARQTGVSPASVTRICTAAGVSFDRTATAIAVEARVIDQKAARVNLAGNLLDDVAEARVRLHRTSEPRDFFDLARSVAVLTNAHVRIISVDGPPDESAEVGSMLGNLFKMLQAQHGADQEQYPEATRPPVLEPPQGDDQP
ncbi:hypothetical protein ACFYXH_00895 [Streptomyces sp. NPDC002730]|uniref:hypothetical protein n=1 Tax=Streptomyces sp. NPDC002730 TaxID=3364662 RepID=UPI0036CB4F16